MLEKSASLLLIVRLFIIVYLYISLLLCLDVSTHFLYIIQIWYLQRIKKCWHVFDSPHAHVALDPNLKSTLDKVVTSQKILLFMKGTKEFPQCGFSNTVVQILKALNAPFETINILENEALRQGLKEYSSWPTFPQLYIDGEFFGGCDIVVGRYTNWYFDMHKNLYWTCMHLDSLCVPAISNQWRYK